MVAGLNMVTLAHWMSLGRSHLAVTSESLPSGFSSVYAAGKPYSPPHRVAVRIQSFVQVLSDAWHLEVFKVYQLLTQGGKLQLYEMLISQAEKLLVTSAVTFRYGLNMNDSFSGQRTFQV